MKSFNYFVCWLVGVFTMYFSSIADAFIYNEPLRVLVVFLVMITALLSVFIIARGGDGEQ